jgi:sterol desaturase/sphingolipid hydroxylase (fatty acid hydroxylase superfamily)
MVPFLLGALGGVLVAPLLEYAWHAWIAHGRFGGGKVPSRKDHLDHHRTAYDVEPPWQEIRRNVLGVLAVDAIACAAASVLVGPLAGAGLATALLVGYCAITIGHAQMHERAPRTRAEAWMWRFHWHHHAVDPRVNHGLTSPIFDFVFRTAVVPERVAIPAWMKPKWLDGEIAGLFVGKREKEER